MAKRTNCDDRIHEDDGFQNIKLGQQFRTLKQETAFGGIYTVLLVKCIVRPKLKQHNLRKCKKHLSLRHRGCNLPQGKSL